MNTLAERKEQMEQGRDMVNSGLSQLETAEEHLVKIHNSFEKIEDALEDCVALKEKRLQMEQAVALIDKGIDQLISSLEDYDCAYNNKLHEAHKHAEQNTRYELSKFENALLELFKTLDDNINNASWKASKASDALSELSRSIEFMKDEIINDVLCEFTKDLNTYQEMLKDERLIDMMKNSEIVTLITSYDVNSSVENLQSKLFKLNPSYKDTYCLKRHLDGSLHLIKQGDRCDWIFGIFSRVTEGDNWKVTAFLIDKGLEYRFETNKQDRDLAFGVTREMLIEKRVNDIPPYGHIKHDPKYYKAGVRIYEEWIETGVSIDDDIRRRGDVWELRCVGITTDKSDYRI